MDDSIGQIPVDNLTLPEVRALRRRLRQRAEKIRVQKSLRLGLILPPDYRDMFDTAKQWAFEHELIPKRSNWAFTKFCIVNTIKMILDEINKQERTHSRIQPPVPEDIIEEPEQEVPELAKD